MISSFTTLLARPNNIVVSRGVRASTELSKFAPWALPLGAIGEYFVGTYVSFPDKT